MMSFFYNKRSSFLHFPPRLLRTTIPCGQWSPRIDRSKTRQGTFRWPAIWPLIVWLFERTRTWTTACLAKHSSSKLWRLSENVINCIRLVLGWGLRNSLDGILQDMIEAKLSFCLHHMNNMHFIRRRLTTKERDFRFEIISRKVIINLTISASLIKLNACGQSSQYLIRDFYLKGFEQL